MIGQSLVVEVSGENEETTLSIGGKANSLNTLVAAGFPVPRAYCVTVDAYNEFLEESGIQNWINSFDVLDSTAFKKIRNRIEDTQLSDTLHRAIVRAYNKIGSSQVAIRSSAIYEDSESQSFAGQFDTFLHVEGEETIVKNVKRCWGSLWTDGANIYQNHNSHKNYESKEKNGIAVVIQEMVDAEVAGILFTADPITGDTNSSMIEACWGLGEGVVSGQVVTDSYIVNTDNFTITESVIRDKPLMSARNKNGDVKIQEVPSKLIKNPTLSDNQAIELASCASAIRKHYGKELDIEWAIKDGKIWILQARPITVSKADEKIYPDDKEDNSYIRNNCMVSRLDVGEIVTGLMTPLGLSFCHFYQHNIHGPAIKTMGLLNMGNPQHFMGYMQGYVYLNISASAKLLTQCPPTRDMMKFTKRYASDEVDFTNYENPYGKPLSGLKYFMSSIYWFGYQIYNLITASSTVKKMNVIRERETIRFSKLDLHALDLNELDKELSRIDHYFLKSCAAYMPFFLQSFALYDALAELCEKWLKDEGAGLQNRIKSSMNNLRTIEVTRGVCKLTERVKESTSLTKLFLDTPFDELIDKLQQNNEGEKFWNEDFITFLNEFGSRGHQEFDLNIPRWNDDPRYLLKLIKIYLVSDIDLETRLEECNSKRDKDTSRLLSKLPFKVRMTFKFVINTYGIMAERRESTRPTFIAETWFYRKIIVEIMTRLSNQGLVTMEDLPYIDFNQFRKYVSGKLNSEEAFSKQLIVKNRNQHIANKRLQEPPLAIIGGFVPKSDKTVVISDDDKYKEIIGLGASPGIIVARARVITDLNSQVENFKQGEILVAKFTDATWTPLFVIASGVIADIGSILSHSSIVSREFGIPAVVNTKIATQLIKTGDLVYLNGDTGVVRIEEVAQKSVA